VGTFLTTRKMEAALVSRIERSVAGSRHAAGRKRVSGRTRKILLRAGCLAGAAALTATAVVAHVRHRREMEGVRAALIESVRAESATVSTEDRAFMSHVEPWLEQLAGTYEGDLVADALRSPTSLEATLSRRSVYVRGPLGAFTKREALPEVAAASNLDAFLRCMIDPPATRTEKAVIAKARAAEGPTRLDRPANRLDDVGAGLRLVDLPWEDRIRAARDRRDVDRLKAEWSPAKVAAARRASKAELLLAAMDEPDEGGPADLDGERPHRVRVGLIDLSAGRVLIRLRKRVDPAWLGDGTRASYASAVDGCALAYDVRAEVVRTGQR
jgi:hypothetical protein